MDVGNTIQMIRKNRKMTIKELAQAANVAPSRISQLENNKANPSLATLEVIAQALHVNVATFFLPQDENEPVLRKNERLIAKINEGETQYLLSRKQFKQVKILYRVINNTYKTRPEPISEFDGYELILVADGTIDIQIENTYYTLEAGDSICYESQRPHRVLPPKSGTAEVIWINIYNS